MIYMYPSKHIKSDHYRPASETPSGWCFAGGPIVAHYGMLAGMYICLIMVVGEAGLFCCHKELSTEFAI